MMRVVDFRTMNDQQIAEVMKRSSLNLDDAQRTALEIIVAVRRNGMAALRDYSRRFDNLERADIRVSEDEIERAAEFLSEEEKNAIQAAYANIKAFHQLQIPKEYQVETIPGVNCSRVFRPIQSVGLYIPGGTAVLPSTVLMLGIPAMLAGCPRIVLTTPAADAVHPAILYAAKLCGITEIYTVGGAQAIAMLAYGIDGITKVRKIFGPGNQFVTAAKMLVSIDPMGAAIDMPAGPSEILIIADQNANPAFVAADLLSQAEHGADSQFFLLAPSPDLIDKVQMEFQQQLSQLERLDYIRHSSAGSALAIVSDLEQAFRLSNSYAPEHLVLHVQDAIQYVAQIQNAGSVFLGSYSPESAGDYASGTNHSLPTSGYAAVIGGVCVEQFMKSMTVQDISAEGLKALAPAICTLADIEGLQAHRNAVTVRLS